MWTTNAPPARVLFADLHGLTSEMSGLILGSMSELRNAFVYYSNEYGWILVPILFNGIYGTITLAGIVAAKRLRRLKQ